MRAELGRITPSNLLATLHVVVVAQATAGFLGYKHTLLGRADLLVKQYPQVLLHQPALNHITPQTVFLLGIAVTQVQDLALDHIALHEVCMGPSLEPVKVALDGVFHRGAIQFLCLLHNTSFNPQYYSLLNHQDYFVYTKIFTT